MDMKNGTPTSFVHIVHVQWNIKSYLSLKPWHSCPKRFHVCRATLAVNLDGMEFLVLLEFVALLEFKQPTLRKVNIIG